MNHLRKLKELRGKPHLHNGKELVINDYELDEENLDLKVTIDGAKSKLNMPISQATDFFNELKPVGVVAPITTQQEVGFASQQKTLVQMRQQLLEVNAILMKDSGNKEFIQKAKAINNNINTMINSMKLEFQVAKEIRRQADK